MVTGFDYLSKDSALQEHWIMRFVAILIDGVIIFAPISIIFHTLIGMSWFFSWWWVGAVLFFYSALFDSAVGGTVGKLLMHMKSVSVSGQMNSSQAILRNVTKLFPPLLLIDWIIGMAIDTNDPRQKWTDQLAKTSVIRYDTRGRT